MPVACGAHDAIGVTVGVETANQAANLRKSDSCKAPQRNDAMEVVSTFAVGHPFLVAAIFVIIGGFALAALDWQDRWITILVGGPPILVQFSGNRYGWSEFLSALLFTVAAYAAALLIASVAVSLAHRWPRHAKKSDQIPRRFPG